MLHKITQNKRHSCRIDENNIVTNIGDYLMTHAMTLLYYKVESTFSPRVLEYPPGLSIFI